MMYERQKNLSRGSESRSVTFSPIVKTKTLDDESQFEPLSEWDKPKTAMLAKKGNARRKLKRQKSNGFENERSGFHTANKPIQGDKDMICSNDEQVNGDQKDTTSENRTQQICLENCMDKDVEQQNIIINRNSCEEKNLKTSLPIIVINNPSVPLIINASMSTEGNTPVINAIEEQVPRNENQSSEKSKKKAADRSDIVESKHTNKEQVIESFDSSERRHISEMLGEQINPNMVAPITKSASEISDLIVLKHSDNSSHSLEGPTVSSMTDVDFSRVPMNEYRNLNRTTSPDIEIYCSCRAPPGPLGLIIGTTPRGPIIQLIKSTSPLIGQVHIGDIIVQVDDIDTQNMSSAELTRIMTEKLEQKERKLLLVRR